MSDLQFYNSLVSPRLEKGMSDSALIAASITADDTRYPEAQFTLEQVAVALTTNLVADPSGVVTRLVTSLQDYVTASGDILVSHKLNRVLDIENPGTIDLGNFLQRQLLLQLAANPDLSIEQADVDALLSLAEVPAPVTEAEVDAAVAAKAQAEADLEAAEAAKLAEQELYALRDSLFGEYNRLYNIHIAPLAENTESTDQEYKDALALMSQDWVDQQ